MVICDRCQRNIAQFECEICIGVYCPDCDNFIHSNKPKSNHLRKKIQIYEKVEKPRVIQKISLNPNLNYLSQSNPNNQNNLLNSDLDNNINASYQKNVEKNKSITLPSPNDLEKDTQEPQLVSQTYPQPQPQNNINLDSIDNDKNKILNNSNSNEFDKIDKMKNYTTYNKTNYFKVKNLNSCILSNTNNINTNNNLNTDNDNDNINIDDSNRNKDNTINDNDNEIRMLQKKIEEQREIINQLKSENNSLEELIEKDRQKKDDLYKEKERLYNRKRKIEQFYMEKQNEIQKIYDLEKYKLIEDYENQMRDISDNFFSRKSEYIRGLQDMEAKMREYEKNNEEEKKILFDEIDRLKSEGIKADKEQEFLIQNIDELNNKLRETNSNMDLLKATALVSTVPKMKSLLKNKKKGKKSLK